MGGQIGQAEGGDTHPTPLPRGEGRQTLASCLSSQGEPPPSRRTMLRSRRQWHHHGPRGCAPHRGWPGRTGGGRWHPSPSSPLPIPPKGEGTRHIGQPTVLARRTTRHPTAHSAPERGDCPVVYVTTHSHLHKPHPTYTCPQLVFLNRPIPPLFFF